MNTTDAPKPTEVPKPVDDIAIESDPQPQPKPSTPENDEAEIADTERQPT